MKRYTFFAFVISLFATTATAQEPTQPRDPFVPPAAVTPLIKPLVLKFPSDTTVLGAVEAIGAVADLGINRNGVVLDEKLGQDLSFTLVKPGDLFAALRQVLSPINYQFWLDSKGILQIAAAGVDRGPIDRAHNQPAVIPPPEPLPTPAPAPVAAPSLPPAQVPAYGNAPVQAGPYYGVMPEPVRPFYPVYQSIPAQAGPVRAMAYPYNNAYGYLNPFAIRDFGNAEKYGLLKIDGPDGFLQSVRVLIDGRDATVGSKSNNKWNQPVLLTAGNHTVEFVREARTADGKPQILAVRRDVEITPMSAQYSAFGKTSPVWLRVSGNEFDNGREVYEYRQHRYVENPEGKIEPKPEDQSKTKAAAPIKK